MKNRRAHRTEEKMIYLFRKMQIHSSRFFSQGEVYSEVQDDGSGNSICIATNNNKYKFSKQLTGKMYM